MSGIKVDIRTTGTLFIEASADEFGRVFAAMTSDDQAAVLAAIAEHMKPHPTQWDYIAIEFGKPENGYARAYWQSMLFPEGGEDPDLIAAAVIAERERCARIVELGLGKTATTIAREIREGGAA
jgi:hypothetical protein